MADYDLIVIGAGPGGYVSAIRAAQKGLKTAVVEREFVGGCCLNRGCVPTKSLMHSAHLYSEILNASKFGLKVNSAEFDIDEIFANKNNTVSTLRGGIEQLLEGNKIDLIRGKASITGANSVKVKGEEEKTYSADKILIAVGGKPARLPASMQDIEGVYSSDDILGDDSKMFKKLIIIGGGVIGVEFATIYNSFGCEVTIIEAQNKILPPMDREISQNLSMILKKRGISIFTNSMVNNIEKSESGVVCTFSEKGVEKQVEADGVLVSIGRRAFTDELLADFSEIERDRGAIIINENYQTSVPNIYAIGDCTKGSIQLAHVASAEGMNAISHMVGEAMAVDTKTIPSCIYTEPEIASVGISPDEAKQKAIAVDIGKYVMTGNAKSILSEQERGFVKIISEKETGKILGAQLMCARATDMIGELACAVSNGLKVDDMAKVIHPHPTFVEGILEAIEDVHKMAVHIMPKK